MGYEIDGQERIFTGHSGRLFLLLTGLLICLQMTQRMLPLLLPTIIDDLSITTFLAGAALTLLRITRASMEYPGGRCVDQRSRTTVLIASVVLVILGLAILSLAVSYVLFLVGIVVLGLGSGFYSPASRALLSDAFHNKRGRAFGLHLLGSDLSGILAAGVVVVILWIATWRGIFLPIAAILSPVLVAFYLVSREPVQINAVEFRIRETGARLFTDPVLRWLVIAYSLFILSGGSVISFLPTFLIDVHGFSFAFESSAFALVYPVGIVSKPVSGLLSDWAPRRTVAGAGLMLASGGSYSS